MAGTNLSFPYDAEIFNYDWKNTPDMELLNMLNSGAVRYDAEIARLIGNGTNYFVTPFYNEMGGDEGVYNGVNDIATTGLTGDSFAGVVFGRQKGWNAKSFINDFNSGADPMGQIVSGVAKYWQKKRQVRLIALLEALFGITGDADWTLHTTNLATTTTTVADTNLIGVTTIGDATIKANGDASEGYTMAIMHSVVASRLANLQLLEYSKYTDASGITRNLPIGTINGKTVIINDAVPVKESATATGKKEYTTFLLGVGAIGLAEAPVEIPSEMDRDPAKFGGQDFIYTRVRECMHPYGFSFKGDATTDVGVPDTVLLAKASWERKMPAKSILMAKVVTNG